LLVKDIISEPTVLTAAAIGQLEARPLGTLDGVTHKVLWHDAGSMSGVLTIEAGTRLGLHAHHANHHHLWMLDGRATILGTELGPGSYVHIPHGVQHDIDASATGGCTVFYLYARPTAPG
jgi:mannose-6-phosphate isomerase-like protein (cupin superfamily)